jgi:hypothetical protein
MRRSEVKSQRGFIRNKNSKNNDGIYATPIRYLGSKPASFTVFILTKYLGSKPEEGNASHDPSQVTSNPAGALGLCRPYLDAFVFTSIHIC